MEKTEQTGKIRCYIRLCFSLRNRVFDEPQNTRQNIAHIGKSLHVLRYYFCTAAVHNQDRVMGTKYQLLKVFRTTGSF